MNYLILEIGQVLFPTVLKCHKTCSIPGFTFLFNSEIHGLSTDFCQYET